MKQEFDLDQYTINVIKGLVMDATRHADSGHPGGPMSSVDFAYTVYKEFLRYSPSDPKWFNRDRFVLSAGHESMLLYSLLTLVGYLELDDLKKFRQYGSRTPGHPESHLTPGVEATTGPLGQGFGMAVGMAAAEEILAAHFGRELIEHFTYVVASDGDLQEPISMGTAALAGHWGLGKLIVFYDKNDIQISGATHRCDTTNYAKVFEGFNWHVQEIDGHDRNAIRAAIRHAQKVEDKPSIIIGHTVIAKGVASMEGSAKTHGEPLPAEEIIATKKKLGLPENQTFFLPNEVLAHFRHRHEELAALQRAWQQRLASAKRVDADFAKRWRQFVEEPIPSTLKVPSFTGKTSMATRVAFGETLKELANQLPNLVGGSADLEPSNKTDVFMKIAGDFTRENRQGRNFAFGVREFPMGTICNGMALHGGLIPFGATFLIFSDYERAALRLAALQGLRVIHEFTHDSFYLGEDGPTHQPIEQIASLRAMPNFVVIRPADATETTVAMQVALEQKHRPTAIMLTRQNVPLLDRGKYPSAENLRRGAYILYDFVVDPSGSKGTTTKSFQEQTPDVIYIATGSEVHLALAAAQQITEMKIRVVNMPSWELFEEQDDEYKQTVLPPAVTARLSIEAGATFGWKKYTGTYGYELGIDHFGDSAKASDLEKAYGFTVENLVRLTRERFLFNRNGHFDASQVDWQEVYATIDGPEGAD
ncbi:MAG: transketolase [candidate division KSB1 bacterium]|nr:transketolase [candidate division KSB1 bacterium]MDZ7366786.1 transketolase [candidate division KSB1 bacterium]MDZ7404798.1 transketolase [candidate division KSB1 bacterium]